MTNKTEYLLVIFNTSPTDCFYVLLQEWKGYDDNEGQYELWAYILPA